MKKVQMDKEKYLQFIASFLIVLVLTIPFYTISVYATINQISVKGGNGIEGFAKSNDFLNFKVNAAISNDTITKDQVILGSGMQFDKCSPSINNGSECTLRFPSNGTESFESKSIPFTINLFRDDKTLDDSKSSTLVIDNIPPQVKLSAQKSTFSSQENVIINYEVTDTACNDASCSGKCVGIKNIEFYTLNGTFKQTIDSANNTNECGISSNINIESKKFNAGSNSVFAKASDKFNQISPETSVTFRIEITGSGNTTTNTSVGNATTSTSGSNATTNTSGTTGGGSGPDILADSFVIIRKGINLNTYSPHTVSVEVFINISDTNLDLNSVTADLSALNPKQSSKNAKASCASVQNELYTCKWSIELNPKNGSSKAIVINASDTDGNKGSVSVTKILTLDDKGPSVQSLSTTTTVDGKIYGKASGNTVIAIFEEQTGLLADDVFLYVGSSKIKAKSCSKESNWVCVWENVNFGSSAKLSIKSDTKDILDNAVSKETSVNVTVDSEAPKLISINISNVGGVTQAFPGLFKIGDKISVIANLTEKNDIFAVADFSKFISDAVNVAGSCQRIQADEHVCTWLTDTIDLQANNLITFNFSDNAGNSLIHKQSLKTYGLENATVPDFWTNSVICSPKTIDRQLGPLINQRLFCRVKLKPKSTSKPVSTVFIGQPDCRADVNASANASILQSFEAFNTEAGSTSPFLKITLEKGDFKINNLTLICSFAVFSKVGTSTITKNPEVENVKIDVPLSNLPLGEVSEEVQDKIDDAKDDAEGIWKLIGTLNKLMFYAKKICQILNTIYTIVAILFTLTVLLKVTERQCHTFPWLEALGVCAIVYERGVAQCGATETASGAADKSKHILNKFCDIVTCKQSLLWGDTARKFVDELPLVKETGKYFNRRMSDYMKPENNLLVATLFECLPGIIYGLDKYRQIKCLYADCLQNAVGKEGLPVTACEDQKAYATCKYVTTELFAVFPWTALFDHFMGLIKNALSNPFTALGVAISLFCKPVCPIPADGGAAYQLCRGARLLTLVGDAAQNVKNIIDEGFQIRTDYCERL